MPNLTESQHQRLRNLVRRSPAFIGMRIEVHDDRVEVVEPHDLVIGFRPIVDRVVDAPQDRWPEIVDSLLEGMLNSLIHGEPELDGPTDELLGRIYPRLKEETDPTDGTHTYGPEIAPGLRLLFGFDLPDRIAILNDDQVSRHGFDQLYEAAINNVYDELPESCATYDDIYLVEGSDYVSALALVLPWVVHAVTDLPDYPHGVLVAMPNHNRLIVHVPRDGAGTRHALSEIARLAAEYHADAAVPLSPLVYWMSPEHGPLDPVAEYAADGHAVIGEDVVTYHSDGFAAALDELDRMRG